MLRSLLVVTSMGGACVKAGTERAAEAQVGSGQAGRAGTTLVALEVEGMFSGVR